MAITVRQGPQFQFDINKMLPGEFAVTTDTHKVYVCMAAGVSKELASVEEFQNILGASEEAFQAFQELINAMESDTVITGLLSDINNIKNGEYTISFSEAEERSNIESTDTIKVILGKIRKFFSSFSDVSFSGKYDDLKEKPTLGDASSKTVANNMTTSEAGTYVADAYQVKLLKDQLDKQNTNLEKIGEYYATGPEEDVTIPSGKSTSISNVTLPAGSYIVTAYIRFAANANGYRYANISSTSGSTTQYVNTSPTGSNTPTVLNLSVCVNLAEETTLHLNVFQSSGSDLNCIASGTRLRAIKVS